jgi:hypothetical protein
VLCRDVRFHFCTEWQHTRADEVDVLFIRFNPATILRKEREYGGQVVPGIPEEEYLSRPRVKQPHYPTDVACRGSRCSTPPTAGIRRSIPAAPPAKAPGVAEATKLVDLSK